MARDRKRFKQRQQRRVRQGVAAPDIEPTHHNVPGALEHASGDVEEFDAALVRGARPHDVPVEGEGAIGGEVDSPGDAGEHEQAAAQGDSELAADDELEPEEGDEFEDVDQEDDEEYEEEPLPAGDGAGRRGAALAPAVGGRGPAPRARRPPGNRAIAFLRASWAELQRVQWPDRRQVAQATAVVLGFVAIAGLYLGLADFVAKKIVDAIL